MNKQEAIEKIKALGPKDAVHCPTEQEAIAFCELMHEAGLKWINGDTYIKYTHREVGESKSYYLPYCSKYTTGMYYDSETHITHKVSDFIGLEDVD